MAAGLYNLQIKRGDTLSILGKLTEDDGTPINLTGRTLAGAIKKSPNDPKVLVDLTVAIRDQSEFPGEFTFSLTATQTGKLPAAATQPGQEPGVAKWYWDLQMTNGEVVDTMLEGFAYISGGITP